MGRLSGKVAIVTASTEGIGFAIAEKLASEGAKVVVSSRREANVKAAVARLKNCGYRYVTGIVCHVGKSEDRKKLYEEAIDKFGGIDILINNAGINPSIGLTADCPEETWDKMFDINVKSSYLLTKEVLPYMKQKNGGSIVYISSLAGLTPLKYSGAYSASKSAVISLTKVFANELGSSNIRVNCIAPGPIETKFLKHMTDKKVMEKEVEAMLPHIPLNRIGEPSDIGGVAAFLCSDDAKYITGETIEVSGGWRSKL